MYKVEAIRTLPFSEVKNQILRQRQEQNFKDSVEKTMAAVKPVYDEQYFNPPQPKPGAENNKMGPQGMNSQPPATPGVTSATPTGPDGPPAPTPASSGAPTPAPSATPTPAPSPTAAPK